MLQDILLVVIGLVIEIISIVFMKEIIYALGSTKALYFNSREYLLFMVIFTPFMLLKIYFSLQQISAFLLKEKSFLRQALFCCRKTACLPYRLRKLTAKGKLLHLILKLRFLCRIFQSHRGFSAYQNRRELHRNNSLILTLQEKAAVYLHQLCQRLLALIFSFLTPAQ